MGTMVGDSVQEITLGRLKEEVRTLPFHPMSARMNFERPERKIENLVDDSTTKPTNPLDRREYIKVGWNEYFNVSPSVVHFGGYDINCVHRQLLRVTNATSSSRRLHILPPSTPFFKATCDKKGLIAPGMAEDIHIEFCPSEWRYYYDCIRIHSDAENLLIPIHGYPVMNDVIFPARIDFGNCGIDEEYTRTVRLECKVPIQFEFEITPVETKGQNEEVMWMEPRRGIVPADGGLEITVGFKPLKLVTYSAQFVVNIAQFNSEPLTCVVTGAARPCKSLDEALPKVGSTLPGEKGTARMQPPKGSERCGVWAPTIQELEGISAPPPFLPGAERPLHPVGGGAGHGDHFTRRQDQDRREHPSPERPQVKRPEFRPVTPEMDFRGVKLDPHRVASNAGVQAVLLQQQGKLRMADLQKAIQAQEDQRREQQGAMEAGASSGVEWIDDEDLTQQVKQMLFAKEFSAMVSKEKEKELKFCVALGPLPPTEEQVATLQATRDDTKAKQDRAQKDAAIHRYFLETPKQRATKFAYTDPIPGFTPDWDIYKNFDWKRRTQILERFKSAVELVVTRNRATYRLSKLNAMLRDCGRDRARVRALCNEVFLGTSNVSGQSKALVVTPVLEADGVREHVFPVYMDSNFRDRDPVAEATLLPNEVWEPMPLKVPLRFQLQGYEELPYSPFPIYVEPRLDQPLMQGAEEEEELEGPQAVVSLDVPSMPMELAHPQLDLYPELSMRMTDDAVMSPAFPMWGREDPYRLHPLEHKFTTRLSEEASGSNSMLALGEITLLSAIWLPRREDWLMEKSGIPKLMKGVESEDRMPQDKGLEPNPHIPPPAINYPTPQSIAKDFYVPKAGQATPEDVKAKLEEVKEGEGTDSPKAEGESELEAPTQYELPRQRRETELDRVKRQARDKRIEELLAEKAAFNDLVSDQRYQFDFQQPGYPQIP